MMFVPAKRKADWLLHIEVFQHAIIISVVCGMGY